MRNQNDFNQPVTITNMSVDVYRVLANDTRIRVKINEDFRKALYKKIKKKSITSLSKKITGSKHTFGNYFKINGINMSLSVLVKLCYELKIPTDRLFSEIEYFSLKGGHIQVRLPRFIDIDREFIEGFSLYIGDGVLSEKSNIAFINSDKNLIKFFVIWLKKYFYADKNKILVYVHVKGDMNYNYYISLLKDMGI